MPRGYPGSGQVRKPGRPPKQIAPNVPSLYVVYHKDQVFKTPEEAAAAIKKVSSPNAEGCGIAQIWPLRERVSFEFDEGYAPPSPTADVAPGDS